MQADWGVSCTKGDPWIVVPWSSKDGSVHYIDLRDSRSRIAEIQEAAQHGCIAAALSRWNQPDSSVFTSKCDFWAYDSNLFDAEDLPGFEYAHGGYIDLIFRDVGVFSSFGACEGFLRAWTKAAASIHFPEGRCEWTLRRARVGRNLLHPTKLTDSTLAREHVDGFACTLYVWGYGSSSPDAESAWAAALMALINAVLPADKA